MNSIPTLYLCGVMATGVVKPITTRFLISLTSVKSTIKSILLGLLLGIAPIVGCTILYFVTPFLVQGNPGSLLSFAVMGLYAMASMGVFITAIIFITHDKPIVGGVSLFVQIVMLIIAISFLSGV